MDMMNQMLATGETQMDAREAKRVFSRIGFAAFAAMLSIQVVQTVLVLLCTSLAPELTYSPWYTWLLMGISTFLVGYPLFFLITKSLPSYPAAQPRFAPPGKFFKTLVISFGAMYLFNYISLALVALVGLLKGGDVSNPLVDMTSTGSPLATFLFGCVGAPITEELVFRKRIIDKMRPFGDKVCIFASAFVFGLFHGNLSQMFYAFALGAIFAYITLKTGSCRTSMVLHFVVNFFGTTLMPGLLNWSMSASEEMMLLVSGLAGLFILAMIVLSLVFFFTSLRKLTFDPPAVGVSGLFGKLFANPGMICYMVVCLLCVAAVTML